jgi:hypothetical protein
MGHSTTQEDLMTLQTRLRRHRGVLSVARVAVILTFAMVLGAGSLATAAEPPDVVFEFPAGFACPDFDLRVEIRGIQDVKKFTDQNGNVVRTLSAGKGSALVFINLTTDATFSLKANGSATHHDQPRRVEYGGSYGAQCPHSLPDRCAGWTLDDAARGAHSLHGRHQRSLHGATGQRQDNRHLRRVV